MAAVSETKLINKNGRCPICGETKYNYRQYGEYYCNNPVHSPIRRKKIETEVSVLKYAIEYEHLKDELVANERTRWVFNQVKENANKFSLELSDVEFQQFFKLKSSDKDIAWLMHKMSAYEISFIDALISYITY